MKKKLLSLLLALLLTLTALPAAALADEADGETGKTSESTDGKTAEESEEKTAEKADETAGSTAGEKTGDAPDNVIVVPDLVPASPVQSVSTGPVNESSKAASTWAVGEVDSAISMNLVPAELQTAYTNNITRAEFAKMTIAVIARKNGATLEYWLKSVFPDSDNLPSPFTDTSDPYVISAYFLGIVNGRGGESENENRFDPDGSITRQEAAKMLSVTAKSVGADINLSGGTSFSDYYAIQDWAKEYVAFVSTAKDPDTNNMVMGGKPDGSGGVKFDPDGSYSREQAIVTIYRLCKALNIK